MIISINISIIIMESNNEEKFSEVFDTKETNPQLVNADEIVKSMVELASKTPDIWEIVFSSISQFPKKLLDIFKRIQNVIYKYLQLFFSMLLVKIAEQTQIMNDCKLRIIWNYIHNSSLEETKNIFEGTIFASGNIVKMKEKYVYFVYFVNYNLGKIDKDRIFKDCSVVNNRINEKMNIILYK